MKINQKYSVVVAFALLAIFSAVLGWQVMKKGKQLKSQQQLVDQLRKEVSTQNSLLITDSLLVRGQYKAALEQYEGFDKAEINDSEFGLGLRMALAKKLIRIENDLANQASEDIIEEDTLAISTPTIPQNSNQLDSLNFVLSKTKMQLAKMKRQLYQKSFGEYLTFTNEKGSQVHYVGQVNGGKANGYGVAILNTGSRYVGDWKDNERHGQGTFYWKDGEYYEGTYQNDKRNGQGTYFWPNGEKYIGQWKDDRRSGKGAFFGKDGKLMTKGIWEDDKMITDTTKPSRKQRAKEKEMASL